MKDKITRIFEITTSPNLMKRLERFLALLHFNGKFGHSGLFGMSLDGDGSEDITVNDIDPDLSKDVNAIGGVGYHVEIARDNSYGGRFFDRKRRCRWEVKRSATLYKDGEIHSTIPSQDWDHPKNTDEKLIPPEKVVVHYRCPQCMDKLIMLVGEISSSAFLCDQCDKSDNFMEITGVSIAPD